MVEPTQPFTLTQDDAIDILQSTPDRPPVQLVALDCNWGPPVSGRFDCNNGGYGINYSLKPNAGRVTSAVTGGRRKNGPGASHGALWLLPKFTPYKLVARSGALRG